MSKNILLVDSRVEAYETIVSAVNPDLCVPIVFDYFTETVETLKDKIRSRALSGATHIGLVQHNYGLPYYRLFAGSTGSRVFNVAVQDPSLETWSELRDFISWCKTTPDVNAQYFDMMACALYSDKNWKYVIDTLTAQTGVTIRASTDETGASSLGGDWFLESHTGVNLKTVYFTEAIEQYKGILLRITLIKTNRAYNFKGCASGSVITWGSSNAGGDSNYPSSNGSNLQSGVISIYSTGSAFAALKSDGSVITWGDSTSGGNSNYPKSNGTKLQSEVVSIYSTDYAFAALKTDGSVVIWGIPNYGGDYAPSSVTNANSGVVDIYSNRFAFAALKNNGSVATWLSDYTYDTVSSSLQSGVVAVYYSHHAFAALKSNGSVITWGSSNDGGDSSGVSSSLQSGVISIYSTVAAFAALKSNGSVITWGNSDAGGDSSGVSPSLQSGVIVIYSNESSFAALKSNGSVVTWGKSSYGGDSSGVSPSLQSGVAVICPNSQAFAALKTDGSVVAWGNSLYGGAYAPSSVTNANSGVVAVYSTNYAFAALKGDGSVKTWGATNFGANAPSSVTSANSGVVALFSTGYAAFAAVKNDGSVVAWGDSNYGANSSSVASSLTSGIIGLSTTSSAFAALKTSASTFDLSGSYYSDMDRYNILRNKETRRRVNLTTLNNNVFTLSSSRDLQILNPNIPAGKTLQIIVPTYVASSYSITSTATLP